MRITMLVENNAKSELKPKHGLSLYIETENHKILFDLGPDNTVFENAEKRNIDLSDVDTVIISHGHCDHGGALKRFLDINFKADIYIQEKVFEPHYSKVLLFKKAIGIDNGLKEHRQIKLLNGDYRIDDELSLFTVNRTDRFYSPANDALYDENGKDSFLHEQNLLISENKRVLITGCSHSGIVNIMDRAKEYHPHICIGGFHLFNPVTRKTVPETLLNDIAEELQKYDAMDFYTCHCTGMNAFQHLSHKMQRLHYMACGDTLEINK